MSVRWCARKVSILNSILLSCIFVYPEYGNFMPCLVSRIRQSFHGLTAQVSNIITTAITVSKGTLKRKTTFTVNLMTLYTHNCCRIGTAKLPSVRYNSSPWSFIHVFLNLIKHSIILHLAWLGRREKRLIMFWLFFQTPQTRCLISNLRSMKIPINTFSSMEMQMILASKPS